MRHSGNRVMTVLQFKLPETIHKEIHTSSFKKKTATFVIPSSSNWVVLNLIILAFFSLMYMLLFYFLR